MRLFCSFCFCGYFLFYCVKPGVTISCYTCDVTSISGYTEANEECNTNGETQCPSNTDSACMVEGYGEDGRSYRLVKKCATDCPLYINTTAEVVRCCTQDNCNRKFTPLPARRGPSPPPIRRYNDIEPRFDPTGIRGFTPNQIGVSTIENGIRQHGFPNDEPIAPIRELKPEVRETQPEVDVEKPLRTREPNPKIISEKPILREKPKKQENNVEKNGKFEQNAIKREKSKGVTGHSKSLFANEHKKQKEGRKNGASNKNDFIIVLQFVPLVFALFSMYS